MCSAQSVVSGSTLRIGSRHFSQSVFLYVKWPARNLSINVYLVHFYFGSVQKVLVKGKFVGSVRYGENFESARGIQTTLNKKLHPSTLSSNLGRYLISVKNACTEITEIKSALK